MKRLYTLIPAVVALLLWAVTATAAPGIQEMDARLALALSEPQTITATRKALQEQLATAKTDADQTALEARLTLLAAFEVLPPGATLDRYEQVVLNTQILDQLSGLARMDADAEHIQGMRSQYWTQLTAFAATQQAEASRVSKLAGSEFIIAQFAGPLEGKLAIIELIGDRAAQTCRWQQAKPTPMAAKVIHSAGPLQVNLQQMTAPLAVLFEGTGLVSSLKNQSRWLNALRMSTPLVFLELSQERLEQTASVFGGQNSYVLPATGANKASISLIDPKSSLVIATWPLDRLHGEGGKRLCDFVNQLITIAKQMDKN